MGSVLVSRILSRLRHESITRQSETHCAEFAGRQDSQITPQRAQASGGDGTRAPHVDSLPARRQSGSREALIPCGFPMLVGRPTESACYLRAVSTGLSRQTATRSAGPTRPRAPVIRESPPNRRKRRSMCWSVSGSPGGHPRCHPHTRYRSRRDVSSSPRKL